MNNAGAGVLVATANNTTISQNSFSNNAGLSIDLDPRGVDPNTMTTLQGVTLNDNNDADAGPKPTGGGDDDEDLSALIGGKEAGASEAGAKKVGDESDDDLLDAIKNAGKDGGGAAAPKKPAGQESDDDLLNEIKGNK